MTLLRSRYRITWESPANIALVKYWGKKANQIPQNASISLTLSRSKTRTSVTLAPAGSKTPTHQFLYDGNPEKQFEGRVINYLERMQEFFPFLKDHSITIDSRNTFPHSSGISSSASFMSSLALGLCSINQEFTENPLSEDVFFKTASAAARLGSGSAARSIYGGYCVWGETQAYPGSSNEFAIPVNKSIHPIFRNYRDAILIVSSEKKSLSSSAGHQLMEGNPYAPLRYSHAQNNINRLQEILVTGDQLAFIQLVEQEALGLHGLIQSSEGGPILLQPGTISLIRAIRNFRADTGTNLCFTLDAGPNIHLLYPGSESDQINEFIHNQAVDFCENNDWIDDFIGEGPQQIHD